MPDVRAEPLEHHRAQARPRARLSRDRVGDQRADLRRTRRVVRDQRHVADLHHE
jgi:hypothetical protein